MDSASKSSIPMPSSTTVTSLPPESGLHVGISLGISCVGMILVPLLTFILFWFVYRCTQKRKLKKQMKHRKQFRRTRLKELQQQEMTEKEKKDSTPESSPRVHHGTRIHFDNVTVNIQVMHCQSADDDHQQQKHVYPTTASSKARWTSSPIFHPDQDADCSSKVGEGPFRIRSKSANLPPDHETAVFWGPTKSDFYHLPAKYDLATNSANANADELGVGAGSGGPDGRLKCGEQCFPSPQMAPASLRCEAQEAGMNYHQMPSPECPSETSQPGSECFGLDAPGTASAQSGPPAHTVPLYTAARTAFTTRGRHLPYLFNANSTSRGPAGKTRAPSGGRPCTLRWISSVDIRHEHISSERGDDEILPLLMSTGVGSRFELGLRAATQVTNDSDMPATQKLNAKSSRSSLESWNSRIRTEPGLSEYGHPRPGLCFTSLGAPSQVLDNPLDHYQMPAETPPRQDTSRSNLVESLECTYDRNLSERSSTGAPSVELKTDPRSLTILDSLQAALDRQHTTRLNVCRTDVLESALRVIRKPTFNPAHTLAVRFVDSHIDSLSHRSSHVQLDHVFEFFRLLLLEISRLEILAGSTVEKSIAYSAKALDSDLYQDCGCLVAMALVHGGPAPRFFSSGAYDVICRGSEGCVDGNTGQCWQRFLSGLSTLGVLDAIQSDAEAMKPYFQPQEEVTLTAEDVQSIFCSIDLSPDGSTERGREERVLSYFWDFLVEVEEGLSLVSLGEVLIYITSSAVIPSLGFSVPPKLTFSEETGRPEVDRRHSVLTLPLLSGYTAFKQGMEKAVEEGPL